MNKGLERALLGTAFVFGGLLHRRVAVVDDRLDTIARAVEERTPRPRREREREPMAEGMPLPTGYGLQVKGPVGEDILLPVCLPPGFELGSLVLKPAFLPEEARPADVPPASVLPLFRPVVAPTPVPATRPTAERLDAAIQRVYSDEPLYHTQVDGGPTPLSSPPPASTRTPFAHSLLG